MKKKSLLLIALLSFILGNLQAETITANSSAGGNLEAAVTAVQPDFTQVTGLKVTGTVDARDFRFIRDSLNATLVSLDLSEVSVVAYSGTGGTRFTDPPMMGAGGGADVQADYPADAVPDFAFYKKWTAGGFPFASTVERKMTELATLKLPVSIETIGNYSLAGVSPLSSSNLDDLTLLTKIGNYAFFKTGIVSITVPASVKLLGQAVFSNCTNLTTIVIPATVDSISINSGFFEGCAKLSSVTFEEPCRIKVFPFRFFYSMPGDPGMSMPELKTFTIPSSVVDVSTAFENFIGTAIECHPDNPVYYSRDGVLFKKADDSFVAFPKGLASYTVQASMTVIPDNMFRDCVNTTIIIESQLTEIGKYAFYNCPITTFDFQSSLVKIGERAFSQTKLSSVSFTGNANLTTVGDNVFSGTETLKSADLSGLNTMGIGMFQICRNLTDVTLSEQLTVIPNIAFSGCSQLESIVIPNSVTTIGQGAFTSCSKLANVDLPSQLETLGDAAFQNDVLIPQFNIPASLVNLNYGGFSGHGFTSTFATITVDAGNPKFTAENGMLYNKDKKILLHIPGSSTPKRVVIPEGVDSIAPYAFDLTNNNNKMIKKLTLPASLKSIGNSGLGAASNLDTLIVKATVPPVATDASFNNSNYRYTVITLTIIVPPQTKQAYITAAGWKNWYNNVNGDDKDHFVSLGTFTDLGMGYAASISPNGRWIVGDANTTSYIFDNRSGVSVNIPDAVEARDVNDLGYVAGTFADFQYILGGKPLTNGGVYRDGVWYSLGLGRYGTSTPPTNEFGTNPYAIDAAGNVYGMSMQPNSTRVVPFAWKYNASKNNYTTDTLAYATPCIEGDQGGRINDVSSDGTIAAGWVSRSVWSGTWQPIYWLSPTDYKVTASNNFSEAKGVSPNGKYIVSEISTRAAIYDVENDTLIVFGVEGSSPTAVSDNGFVVGFAKRGATIEAGRQAFVWSEKLGWTWMRDFIDKYCPNMEMPYDKEFPNIFDFSKTVAVMDVPGAISADGMVIAGWSGYTSLVRKGWVLNLAEALSLIDRPHNLRATVDAPARTKVTLSWDAPADFGTHSLDFYMIYRNGEFLARIDANDAGTTYIDENSPVGYNIYTVSAVFDYESSTQYNESGTTNEATVTIVDNYDLPFADSFDYANFRNNFWEAGLNASSSWGIARNEGFNRAGSAALFLGSGSRAPYDLSLTSKLLDATGKDKIILSYLFRLPSENEEFVGKKDTVAVEIGVNGVWTEVQKYIVNQRYGWTPATLDISNVAANKLFQIRFRAVSGENRTLYYFIIDDLGVDMALASAPTDVKAIKYENEDKVRVYYKDASGSYGYSYFNGKISGTVGNEGISYMAAEKLEPKDIRPLAGKYLTSVSAFINGDYAGTTTPTQLRLAVFVNGQRVDNTTIGSYTGNSWNNFALSQPVQITGTDTLLVGLEVVTHQAGNAPLTMDNGQAPAFSNSKLLSYDGGKTWSSASAENYYDPEINDMVEFNGAWVIVAKFRDENAAQQEEDDFMTLAYNIYRNETLISTLHYGQVFTDTAGFTASDCYRVSAFKSLGGMSGLSEQGCISILNSLSKPQIAQFEVYPNPARSYVNVSIDFEKLTVFDAQGKKVTTTKESRIDVSGFARGLYILEATLKDGKRAVARVIVE